MNNELTTLMNTLMQNNLAGSLEEAKRMAESMLGTSSKVSKPYQENTEHFMVKGFKKSTSEVLGETSEPQDHPPSYSEMNDFVHEQHEQHIQEQFQEENLVHQHQSLEQNNSQKLSLNNPTTYQKAPEPEPVTNNTLSLQNTVSVTPRKKEELKEGVLAQGMPDTSNILSSQNIDPVTSAPLDIESKQTQAQIPAHDPSQFNDSIMQQVREQAEIADKEPEPLPSLNPTEIAQRPLEQGLRSSNPQMSPEEYAAQRMGLGSLNELSTSNNNVSDESFSNNSQNQVLNNNDNDKEHVVDKEHDSVLDESIQQVHFEHPQHSPNEEPVQKDPSLDEDPHLQQVHFEHPQAIQDRPEPEVQEHVAPSASQQAAPSAPQQEARVVEIPPIPGGQVQVPRNEFQARSLQEGNSQAEPENQQKIRSQGISPQESSLQNQVQEGSQPEHTQQIPTGSHSEEKNQFGTPKRDPVELTPEEKKLKEDVDLSKIFNSGN